MQTTLFFDSKMGFGRSEDFTTAFIPPLVLKQDAEYEVSLISATMWHSWRNITRADNKFVYFNGTSWKTIGIPEGAYNIPDIDAAVKRMMKANGDFDNADKLHPKYYIHIEANYNTLHSHIVLDNGYKVDFMGLGTICGILSFSAGNVGGDGDHESKQVVNITDIESLQINCDLISDSYVNGSTSSVLYSLSPNVPPGYLIQVNPSQQLKVSISRRGLIGSVRFYITNQSGNLVDMNNERVTYFLHLNKIRGLKQC